MTELAGAFAALAVLFTVGGYAVIQQRRRYDARLQIYLAGSTTFSGPLVAPVEQPTKQRPSNPLIGINPLTLVQAGMTITARRFLIIQLSTGLFGLAVAWLLGQSLES